MTDVCVSNLSYEIEGQEILSDISMTIAPGKLVVLLGSNGSGKSTLMKCVLGLLAPTSGSVTIDGVNIQSLNAIDKARRLSYLPQRRPMAWPITVRDVVALGRFAYGASVGKLRGPDERAVEEALSTCELVHLKHRRIDTLSGGETTRVHCARTFAAEAPLLFADEPTTALDPRHQLDIMQRLRSYVSDEQGAFVVAHEPALAARFADTLVWMKAGRIIATGSPAETLTSELLAKTYGIRARVFVNEDHPVVDMLGPVD